MNKPEPQLEKEFQTCQSIKGDLSHLPYLRYYVQEQAYQGISLPFNQTLSDTLSELTISSKLIANNTRLTSSFIENGMEILKKKKEYMQNFLNEYPIINQCLSFLPHHYQVVVNGTVMALSNLILKLSINLSKISILCVTRLITPPQLNVFTMTILFEKFMELQLITTKFPNAKTPAERREGESTHLIKQSLKNYPKTTYIKISQNRNPYDCQLLAHGQQLFGPEPNNLQFIELFINEPPRCSTSTFGSEKDLHFSLNLFEKLGLTMPLGDEFFVFFSEFLTPKIADFRPDVIMYVEQADDCALGMQHHIRGMMLNELSSKVQNKIYVFRQFGISDQVIRLVKPEAQLPRLQNLPQEWILNEKPYLQFMQAKQENIVQYRQRFIKTVVQRNCELMDILFKDYHQQLIQFYKHKNPRLSLKDYKPQPLLNQVNEMKKNLLQELSYLSLAMIQKSNFEEEYTRYRNRIIPEEFLGRLLDWLGQLKILAQEKGVHSEASYVLRSRIERVNIQLECSRFARNNQNSKGFTFYNIVADRTETLCMKNGQQQGQPVAVKVEPKDSVYVAYQNSFLAVFVFTDKHFKAYIKKKGEPSEAPFTCVRVNDIEPFLMCEGATLVASSNYLYRAFGQGQFTGIYRLQITSEDKVANSNWEQICLKDGRTVCKSIDEHHTDEKNMLVPSTPIEKKKYGFGISYSLDLDFQKDGNLVVFGGGLNYACNNQEKVNRFLYVIKNDSKEIWKVGKTNLGLADEAESIKQKNVLYPFIYGVPLRTQKSISILSTNGYMEHCNNFKKLFLSEMREGEPNTVKKIGLVRQNRIRFDPNSPEDTVANKNSILSMLIHSYHRINRHKNKAVIYDTNDQPYLLDLSYSSQESQKVTVRPVARNQEIEDEGEEMELRFVGRKTIAPSQVQAFRKK